MEEECTSALRVSGARVLGSQLWSFIRLARKRARRRDKTTRVYQRTRDLTICSSLMVSVQILGCDLDLVFHRHCSRETLPLRTSSQTRSFHRLRQALLLCTTAVPVHSPLGLSDKIMFTLEAKHFRCTEVSASFQPENYELPDLHIIAISDKRYCCGSDIDGLAGTELVGLAQEVISMTCTERLKFGRRHRDGFFWCRVTHRSRFDLSSCTLRPETGEVLFAISPAGVLTVTVWACRWRCVTRRSRPRSLCSFAKTRHVRTAVLTCWASGYTTAS